MTTPLMQAIEARNNDVVKYLINVGASMDIKGEDGMTSLHVAAKCGNIEAVHYIINTGKINVNLQVMC
jgi:euchromatic histone-lysine N-methyltransferase